jgi:hypothetical protein
MNGRCHNAKRKLRSYNMGKKRAGCAKRQGETYGRRGGVTPRADLESAGFVPGENYRKASVATPVAGRKRISKQ